MTPTRRFSFVPKLLLAYAVIPGCSYDWTVKRHPDAEVDLPTPDAEADEVDTGIVRDADDSADFDSGSEADSEVGQADLDAAADADVGTTVVPEPPSCYLDADGDGVGAGDLVQCVDPDALTADGGPPDASTPAIARVKAGGDCDDHDPKRSPSLSDICGDNIDNDCDGTPDDEANNACGGPCTQQLGHQPGEVCVNGLLGACKRAGTYECSPSGRTACNAPSASPSGELCGDSVDNDCDGLVDEADAANALTWFQDCDGDGYAASTAGSVKACTQPGKSDTCSWTSRVPQPDAKSNWDCDDRAPAYHSGVDFGLPPMGYVSVDLNCDGVAEQEEAISSMNAVWTDGSYVQDYRCDAALACSTCAAASPNGIGSQWLSGTTPTNTKPPCSTSLADAHPYRTTFRLVGGTCSNGNWLSVSGGGVQRCR